MVPLSHVSVVPTLIGKQLQANVCLFIVGNGHPAVARRHVFGLLQAETTDMSERPHVPAPESGCVGLAAILDQDKIVSIRNIHNRIHVARPSKQVHQNNRPGPVRNGRLDRPGRHVQCPRIHVGEYRHRVLLQDRHHAAGIGNGRGDDLIARLRVHGPHGKVDGRRSTRGTLRVSDAVEVGKSLLEFPYEPAALSEQILGAHRCDQQFLLPRPKRRPRRKRAGPYLRPSVDRQFLHLSSHKKNPGARNQNPEGKPGSLLNPDP